MASLTDRSKAGGAAWRVAALLLLGMVLTGSPIAHAAPTADAAFTIGNYPVEAVDKDAVRAKEKALADGQQGAFRSLLRRLVPVTAYRRLPKLQPKPAEMVDGVSVRSERNSSTQYIANLDFAFQPQAVRNYLKREGMPFVDTQAPEVVIVPVLRNAQGAGIDAGPWADAWKGLDIGHAIAPVRVEALKEAVHADTVKMALGNDAGGAERILTGEYKSDRVVLAIADVDTAARRLHVVLVGHDAVGHFRLKRSWRLAGDQAYALEFAAVVGLGVLEGRWKATQTLAHGADTAAPAPAPWSAPGTAMSGGSGQTVQLQAEFASLGEWNDMRRQLLDTPGVEGVEIGTMTARSADITLRFPGGGDRLAQVLSAQGLNLQSAASGWSLKTGF